MLQWRNESAFYSKKKGREKLINKTLIFFAMKTLVKRNILWKTVYSKRCMTNCTKKSLLMRRRYYYIKRRIRISLNKQLTSKTLINVSLFRIFLTFLTIDAKAAKIISIIVIIIIIISLLKPYIIKHYPLILFHYTNFLDFGGATLNIKTAS